MSDYNKSTDFAIKDTLLTGDPNKIVSGQEIDAEYNAIATAVATKTDKISGGTTGNLVALDNVGNLIDAGQSATALVDLINNSISNLQDTLFPVGSVYMNANTTTNPATLLGFGTWDLVSQGRALIGHGNSTPDDRGESRSFPTLQATAGSYQHVLSEAEMPAHSGHSQASTSFTAPLSEENAGGPGYPTNNTKGSSSPHNNTQPYFVVAMWRRTA